MDGLGGRGVHVQPVACVRARAPLSPDKIPASSPLLRPFSGRASDQKKKLLCGFQQLLSCRERQDHYRDFIEAKGLVARDLTK